MVNLSQYIARSEAERTIILTYNLNLPFFESQILDDLQQGGEGQVLILADWREHSAAFSEASAVRHAGSSYQALPVVLPNMASIQHAKLYLLARKTELRALVASANLTPTGLKRNAEVVDEVRLTAETGDVHAFARIAELLRFLLDTHPAWPAAARAQVQRELDAISKFSATAKDDSSSLELLHSINESIGSQLIARVPKAGIKAVTVISPFFDPGGRAIVHLAEAYPEAKLRIIKSANRQSLNGAALKGLAKRLSVEELTRVDEHARRLHGKLIALRATDTSYVMLGSANATAPAMLHAVLTDQDEKPGNLELVSLHAMTSAHVKRRFTDAIQTISIPLGDCDYKADSEQPEDKCRHLPVWSAELTDNLLSVVCAVPAGSSATVDARIAVEATGARVEDAITLHLADDATLKGAISISDVLIVGTEQPSVVSLSITLSGVCWRGRAWLARPALIAMSALSRRRHLAFAHAMSSNNLPSSIYDVIVDAIETLVSLVGSADSQSPQLHAFHGAQLRSGKDDATSSHLWSLDDLVVEEEELAHRSGVRRTTATNLLDDLLRVVNHLFDAPAPVSRDAAPNRANHVSGILDEALDDVGDGLDFEDADLDDKGNTLAPTAQQNDYRAIRKLVRRLGIATASCFRAPTVPERASYVSNVTDAVLGAVVLRVYARLRADDSEGAVEILPLWGSQLAELWSLGNLLDDDPKGWWIRLLLVVEANGQNRLKPTLGPEWARHGCYLACYLLAEGERAQARHAEFVLGYNLASVLQGQSVSQVVDAVSVAFEALNRQLLLPWTGADCRRVLSVTSDALSAFDEVMQYWLTIEELAGLDAQEMSLAESRFDARLEVPVIRQVQRMNKRKLPLLAQVHMANGLATCGECGDRLSTKLWQQLRVDRKRLECCESCGRLLVPVQTDSAVAKAVRTLSEATKNAR